MRAPRTTFPDEPIFVVPGSETVRRLVGGNPANDVSLPSHGSWASCTPVPALPLPFRYLSNHLTARPRYVGVSAGGFGAGTWPTSPRYSSFGPASCLYAVSAWSMSKRKSWRPWTSSVGTEIDGSCASGDRAAAAAAAAAVTVPCASVSEAASRSGSQRDAGVSAARSATSSVFATPCGASAVCRFVHVITGTIALKGTPAAVAFHTAPPPSEMPSAPISVSDTSGLSASQL